MKICFVVCPIGSEGSETRKRSDELLNYIIKPVCEKCGFEAVRVDNINASDSINNTILEYLNTADLVIADLTEHNPNAFYELGYRFALNKPLIQLKHKNDKIPFDVASIRTLDYDLQSLPATDNLKDRLVKTINSFNYDKIEETKDKTLSDSFNSIILQELYNIQDNLNDLSNKIFNSTPKSDTGAISVLADKIATNSKKDADTVLMETILPIILENPDKLKNLFEFTELFPKK